LFRVEIAFISGRGDITVQNTVAVAIGTVTWGGTAGAGVVTTPVHTAACIKDKEDIRVYRLRDEWRVLAIVSHHS
jgi:uncharacterized spore protein YtfJ